MVTYDENHVTALRVGGASLFVVEPLFAVWAGASQRTVYGQ